MEAVASLTEANRALRKYLAHADGALPEKTFAALEKLADSPSPVYTIVRTAELLYANRDQLDNEGRTVTAQLAAFAALNAWHGMSKDNRGGRIAQAMMRDSGAEPEAGQPPFPDAENDPEALELFTRPPAPPIQPGASS